MKGTSIYSEEARKLMDSPIIRFRVVTSNKHVFPVFLYLLTFKFPLYMYDPVGVGEKQ